ncbi:hypothetical protein GJU39_03620 [Pedobacter petrophilus]|uniref:PRMT5 arginine-N-methyltransferase domain-containing protein n=1 Tax=Pedobacter petrophilus TaxID=1908241 RepID=A0A7K0FUA5_9SPHI|nr:hypothetical protein [Pedobacter petrophilus]MRX75168.1 hypothetical protein [Pedobacter petrophilus]
MYQTQNLKEQLQSISNDLILPGDFHDKLVPAITAYTKLLFDIGKIEPEKNGERNDVKLPFGHAIGTFWAANCVKEVLRTQRFVRGLYEAVQDKLAQKSGPVHVLYAGTGPFATLALPVMAQFSADEVQFTLLEINETSHKKLLDVIKAFDLNKYIRRIEITDATTCILPDTDVDIVLSETLNRALITEPQVFIMLNLASQLGENVIFLPEEITVNLSEKKKKESEPRKIKTLINFNHNKMKDIIRQSEKYHWVFDEVGVNIGDVEPGNLYYTTEIKVYRNNFLGYEDSSLNLLERVKLDQEDAKAVTFKYYAAGKVGFSVYSNNVLST